MNKRQSLNDQVAAVEAAADTANEKATALQELKAKADAAQQAYDEAAKDLEAKKAELSQRIAAITATPPPPPDPRVRTSS